MHRECSEKTKELDFLSEHSLVVTLFGVLKYCQSNTVGLRVEQRRLVTKQ